jgi:hypothetical protein
MQQIISPLWSYANTCEKLEILLGSLLRHVLLMALAPF